MKIYAIFLLAHLLADFLFQPDSLINLKESSHKKGKFWNKGIFWHSLIQYGTTLLLLAVYGELWVDTLLAASCVFICHYLIDRSKFQWKLNEFWKFILDQLAHYVIIYLVLWMFRLVIIPQALPAYLVAFGQKALPISLGSKILLGAILVICLIWVSGQLIKVIMKTLQLRPFEENLSNTATQMPQPSETITPAPLGRKEPQTGLYIGWVERALIGIFMVMAIHTSLALLATLKTLARFKQLENRANAEYFILGTLLSILLGVSFGAMMYWIVRY